MKACGSFTRAWSADEESVGTGPSRRVRWAAVVVLGLELSCRSASLGAESPGVPCAPESSGASAPASASAGGARALPGTPFSVVRRHNHRVELGELGLEVDAVDGGRIVDFSLSGRNILATMTESPLAYGSSFWPSPQKDWDWPPPPELDAMPWEVAIEGRDLVLRSGTNAALGLSAVQRITLLEGAPVARIDLTLENQGATPRAVAGWQNTRMRPGGLTFFPMAGEALAPSAFPLEPRDGVAWFEHDAKAERRQGKVFADGEEGWLAHVDGDVLFVKVFPPVPRDRQAPGEAEVELYVDPRGAFVEIEQQGPYETIAPGGSMAWRCHWLLARLAPEARRAPGNEALLRQARALVQAFESAPATR